MAIKAIEQLSSLLFHPIEVTIEGEKDEDKPPAVRKMLMKLEPCPDQTHLRAYFDSLNFIAFPLNSEIRWRDDCFQAYDPEAKLLYTIKKGS